MPELDPQAMVHGQGAAGRSSLESGSKLVYCGACGSPMQRAGAGAWSCPACGASKQVAEGHLQRSEERLRRLREAVAAAEAPLVALAEGTLRRHLMPLGVGVVMLLFRVSQDVGSSLWSLHAAGSAIDAATRGQVLRNVFGISGLSLGLIVGSTAGYIRAWRILRGHLESFRRAKPPLVPGSPARCRCCGAALPGVWGGVATCAYCATTSLLDPNVVNEREAVLADETTELRERAARSSAAMQAFVPRFTNYWAVGAGVGGASLALLGLVVALVLTPLFGP